MPENLERRRVTPPGNSDGYQNKGNTGKAIRKNMKTKDGQNRRAARTPGVAEQGRDETGTRPAEP